MKDASKLILIHLNVFFPELFLTPTVSKLGKRNPYCPLPLFSSLRFSSSSFFLDPSFFLCLALFFLLFLCVSRIEIKCAVCKISTVMGICSLGLNDPQVSGFITN